MSQANRLTPNEEPRKRDPTQTIRPLFFSFHLATVAVFEAVLSLSSATSAGLTTLSEVSLRGFLIVASLVTATASWKLWMRKEGAGKWGVAAVGFWLVAILVFLSLKDAEETGALLRSGDKPQSP